jgi:hypothetical protein
MKILEILSQDKETLEKKKAERVAKALARKQEALIDKLEDQKDTLLAKKDSLLSITVSSVNQETWNDQLQETLVELTTLDKQIEIAKNTSEEFFSETQA